MSGEKERVINAFIKRREQLRKYLRTAKDDVEAIEELFEKEDWLKGDPYSYLSTISDKACFAIQHLCMLSLIADWIKEGVIV